MTAEAGVLRSAGSLALAADGLARAAMLAEAATDRDGDVTLALLADPALDVAADELRNLATIGAALVLAARARTESRGAHTRTDHPEERPDLRVRFVNQR